LTFKRQIDPRSFSEANDFKN
jgi:hypothetical protein